MAIALLAACLGLGFVTGLRSMMGPAAVAWGARLGLIHLQGTGFAFLGHSTALVVLTLAALGELVGDKFRNVPARTSPGPFVVRLLLGAACGVALALARGVADPTAPAVCGAAGAFLGTLGGYRYRVRVPRALRLADYPFAILEDLFALGLAVAVISSVGR